MTLRTKSRLSRRSHVALKASSAPRTRRPAGRTTAARAKPTKTIDKPSVRGASVGQFPARERRPSMSRARAPNRRCETSPHSNPSEVRGVTRRAIGVTELARIGSARRRPTGIEHSPAVGTGKTAAFAALIQATCICPACSHRAQRADPGRDTGTPVAAGLARSIDRDHRRQPNSWRSCGVVVTTTVDVPRRAASGPRCQSVVGRRPWRPGQCPTAVGAGRLQASRLCRARKASSWSLEDESIGELRKRTEPEKMARELSRNVRTRGL